MTWCSVREAAWGACTTARLLPRRALSGRPPSKSYRRELCGAEPEEKEEGVLLLAGLDLQSVHGRYCSLWHAAVYRVWAERCVSTERRENDRYAQEILQQDV